MWLFQPASIYSTNGLCTNTVTQCGSALQHSIPLKLRAFFSKKGRSNRREGRDVHVRPSGTEAVKETNMFRWMKGGEMPKNTAIVYFQQNKNYSYKPGKIINLKTETPFLPTLCPWTARYADTLKSCSQVVWKYASDTCWRVQLVVLLSF